MAWKRIPLMLENVPSVSKAEILYDAGVFGHEFGVQVLFKTGDTLMLYRVNRWGKGDIEIAAINNYRPVILNEKGIGINPKQEIKFWSLITGLQLETIVDLAKNYNIIYDHMMMWPNLSDYKEYEDEKLYRVSERVMKNNRFTDNTVVIEREKFSFFRWRSAN
jgi:hypothetical protein